MKWIKLQYLRRSRSFGHGIDWLAPFPKQDALLIDPTAIAIAGVTLFDEQLVRTLQAAHMNDIEDLGIFRVE